MKIFTKLLTLVLLLVISQSYAFAYDVEVDGIYYNLNDTNKTAEVTYGGTSFSSALYKGEVVIPSEIVSSETTYSVTSIGYSAFYSCDSLNALVIPNSVTSIGDEAFESCKALTSITIGNSVTSIGHAAFRWCTSLVSITIPESVTDIRTSAFVGCTSLSSIDVAADNPEYFSIDGVLFYNSSIVAYPGGKLGEYTIPEFVTRIGSYAFGGCKGLTSIDIPNYVESIYDGAFSGCESLTSVTIPSHVMYIGSFAFSNCTSLTSIDIPNSVRYLEQAAFYKCTSLTSVTIGNSVTSIGKNTFQSCANLASASIGNSVTSIGYAAFDGCESLTSIDIPNSVTSIESYAFQSCGNLKFVTIGNSVTSIGHAAFRECTSLAAVHITDVAAWCNIDFAFWDANPLFSAGHLYLNGEEIKDLFIPDGTQVIKNYAFCGCTSFKSVTIPNSVTSIGEAAFAVGDNLVAVHITDIAAWCNIDFASWEANPLLIAGHLYLNGEEIKDLFIPNGTQVIKNYAFIGCTSLTSVTIGNSVTSIGECAFIGCTSLTSVTIGNSVTSIGERAFEGCESLKSVTIGNSVTSIGYAAFAVGDIVAVHITDIAAWCNIDFADELANPLRNVGHLYLNGEEIKDLVIPNGIKVIKNYTFYGCTSFKSVTIPNSVTSIGVSAFYECGNLTSIYALAKTPPVCDSNSFYYKETACILYVPTGCKEAYAAADVWKEFENIVEMDMSGIDAVKADDETNGTVKEIFTLDGKRIAEPQHGVNIVRYSNGTTRKVIVK